MADDPEFNFTEILPRGEDNTEYRLISTEGVSTFETPEGTFLRVEPEAIRMLTATAMREIAHFLNFATSSTTPKLQKTTSSSPSICSRIRRSQQVVFCLCAKTPAPRS